MSVYNYYNEHFHAFKSYNLKPLAHLLLDTLIVIAGPSTQDFVVVSAAGLPGRFTLSAGQTSVRVPFNINNDEVGLEDLETYLAFLSLTSEAMAAGHSLGALTQATVSVTDDDGISIHYKYILTHCLWTLYDVVYTLCNEDCVILFSLQSN